MQYTLKQAADLFGTTKNTVKYRVSKLPGSCTAVNADGLTVLTDEGMEALRRSFESAPSKIGKTDSPTPIPTEEETASTENPNRTTATTADETTAIALIESLRQTIAFQQKELDFKNREIERLQDLLQTAQELHKLEQFKNNRQNQPQLIESTATTIDSTEEENHQQEPKNRRHWWSIFRI